MTSLATMSAPTWTPPRTWTLAAAFLVCGTLLFVPLIIFLMNEGSYLQTAHESLAYRYFFPYRLASGEQAALWTPQGWTTAILQRVIFLIEGFFVSPESALRESMELFGALTTAVQAVLGLALLGVAFWDRALDWIQKASVAMALLIPVYCTANVGWQYWMLPDYYQLNVVLLAGLAYASFKSDCLVDGKSWITRAILLGTFLGVVVANKVSLAIACMVPLIPVVIGRGSWRRTALVLVISGASAIGAVLATWLLMYAPRWSTISRGLELWFQYAQAPGGDVHWSTDFVQQSLRPYNYDVMALLYVAVWLGVAVLLWSSLGWRSRWLGVSAALILLAAVAPLPVLVRLSGTTLYEIFLTLTTVTAVQLGLLGHLDKVGRAGRRVLALAVLAFFVACGIQPIRTFANWRPWIEHVKQSRNRAELVWSLQRAMQAPQRPIIFITPNNDYRFATVEEALLRGFSDFPTWSISTGQQGIDRIYRTGLTFRELGSALNHPSAPYPSDAMLVWVDVIRPDYKLLPDQFPTLADAISRPGVSCQQTPDPYDPYHRLTICTPAPARARPSLTSR
jgi:hypothetical protein